MRVLFDTSVIVAALLDSHIHHSESVLWLDRARNYKVGGCVSTHTLAETYSTVTRMPVRPRMTPALVQQQISVNFQTFTTIELTLSDYETAIARMVSLNLPGGGIYDALIAQAALKADVNVLLTFNPKHFTRLGDETAALVQVPG